MRCVAAWSPSVSVGLLRSPVGARVSGKFWRVRGVSWCGRGAGKIPHRRHRRTLPDRNHEGASMEDFGFFWPRPARNVGADFASLAQNLGEDLVSPGPGWPKASARIARNVGED